MGDPHPSIVVLDRDGVINYDSPNFIRTPDEWLPLPGSLQAIADLTQAGFTVVVASNQSGVGRGLFNADGLAAIHRRMTEAVEAVGGSIAGIFVCPHTPDDNCACRKPLPGLLRQVEARFDVSLQGQPVIGDSLRDLEAAWRISARAMLVKTGNGLKTVSALEGSTTGRPTVEVFADLARAASQLIAERNAC
ncbi:MAG: D-glycero-beta-D-manno-heptose 1,7-bisphosphate 7-phosphatase [Gammaproteobacteria bacterium]